MKFLILLLFAVAASAEQLGGLLDAVPLNIMTGLAGQDSKMLDSKDDTSHFKADGPAKPLSLVPPMSLGAPIAGPGKLIKAAAAAPVKTLAAKKAAAAAKILAVPKLKAAALAVPKLKASAVPMKAALMKKPKVHSLKPIVYVIQKPVPVYHKVPVPKKVFVPKFYPVFKKIPVPKIIPVPFKVPVKKIIPKIVKIPKAVFIPKFVPVKKPVPFAIPYPVPKFKRFPVPKPVPYAKYIPIPIPKKVPKFIPVPIKKIIKVPKPYYVPIRVPHFSASYVKTPMAVNVPNIKKPAFGSFHGGKLSGVKKPSIKLPMFNQGLKLPGSNDMKNGQSLFGESFSNLGDEDKELLKMLTGGIADDRNKL